MGSRPSPLHFPFLIDSLLALRLSALGISSFFGYLGLSSFVIHGAFSSIPVSNLDYSPTCLTRTIARDVSTPYGENHGWHG